MEEYTNNDDLILPLNISNGTLMNLSALYDAYWDESDLLFQRIINVLNVYVIPIIIIIGLIGNTICFLVYICTPHLSRQSSSVYLAFLAAVDNGFLVSLFVVWFGWVGIHVFHKNGWCQTILYCTYVCSFLSAWTVVSFTVERWIVVFHPLRRHQLCTRKRAILVMTALTLFALGFYSFSLWKTGIRKVRNGGEVCASSVEYHAFLKVIMGVDTIITVIIPLVSIVCMNTGIGIKICRYANSKSQIPIERGSVDEVVSNLSMFKTNCMGESIEFSTRNGIRLCSLNHSQGAKARSWRLMTKRHHTQLRITRALLIVSTVFVVLNLPSSAFRVQALVLSLKNEIYKVNINAYVWQEFLQFLHYISFSSNFFLYSACSRNFRYALKKLLRRARHKIRNLSAHKCTIVYNLMFVKAEEAV